MYFNHFELIKSDWITYVAVWSIGLCWIILKPYELLFQLFPYSCVDGLFDNERPDDVVDCVGDIPGDPFDAFDINELTGDGCGVYWYWNMLCPAFWNEQYNFYKYTSIELIHFYDKKLKSHKDLATDVLSFTIQIHFKWLVIYLLFFLN